MRSLLQTILSTALLFAFTAAPALAQTKIATVNLEKVFYNYYKYKIASADIQEHANSLDKDYTSMAEDLKKRTDQYEQLLESADDQAVSDQERARRRQAAADQYQQLQDSRAALETYERQAQINLADQRQRMRDNILAEIKKAVADKAKAAGDSIVLDTSAQTVAGTPAVLFCNAANDLTDDVLKQLNASAPPDLPELASPPPVLVSTNTLPYNNTLGN